MNPFDSRLLTPADRVDGHSRPAARAVVRSRRLPGSLAAALAAEVLEIGLSTGSWTWVLSRLESVRHLTVVEINRDYPQVASRYQPIASILSDPKVTIEIDDARRWLRNHPDRKFDLIVMNTTYHWRSNSTNLLSREFLELARLHLNPGGVIDYNTTGSKDVLRTAAQVFSHVTMVSNFVAASDAPFDQSAGERRSNLLRFIGTDGKPLLQQDDPHRGKLAEFTAWPLPDMRDETLHDPLLRVVTDDNMAVEYKHEAR